MSDSIHRGRLLWASFLTLIAAGIGFGVRGKILADWANQYGFTMTELGTITGGGLVGFGVVILLASLITDKVGYKAILMLAAVLHVLSAVVTLAATPVFNAGGKDSTYWCLYIGMFMFAIANGLCECVINPLVAQIYPKQKTHYLNILHAGWPAGLVLGGVIGYLIVGRFRWEVPMALYLIPVVWFTLIVIKEKFPVSDVHAAGLGFGDMVKEFFAPILLFLLFLHACVGYVELGTDSWIQNITDNLTGGQGPVLFIYASVFMFVLRFFAGPIVERINPLGLLCLSAALGSTGLYLLGSASGAAMIWIAMTIYALGKTFLWPTMLGVVAERYPRGGALTIGAIGGIGMLSAGLLGGPGIGYKQDYFAAHDLEAKAPDTYARYQAANENRFLAFPPVKGLDGAKVGVLLNYGSEGEWTPGAQLASDTDLLKEQGTYESNASLVSLNDWWQGAEPYKEEDKEPVSASRIFGGQNALKVTALVPATMFIGYLILVLYFASTGGYKQVELHHE